MQDLGLLAAHCIGMERDRRFHCDEAEKLHYVVGNHVAQRARSIKISSTLFDAYSLGIRYLHVVNVAAVPNRLEDGVVETKHQNVLHRFFAEVMVDAVDLVFRQHGFDFAVQSAGRIEVMAERLLDNHSPPAAILLVGKSNSAQPFDDGGKEFGRGRKIEENIAFSIVLLIYLAEAGADSGVGGRVSKIAMLIIEPLLKPIPGLRTTVISRQE